MVPLMKKNYSLIFLLILSIITKSHLTYSEKNQVSDSKKVTLEYLDNGNIRYTFPDGVSQEKTMEGKTPYGLNINEEVQKIQKKNYAVTIIYSKMLSDDDMDKYVKKFYDEFTAQITKKVSSVEDTEERQLRIVISNCKYIKTGYCRRKNRKELTITSFTGETKEKEVSFHYNDLLKKDEYLTLAHDVYKKIFEE